MKSGYRENGQEKGSPVLVGFFMFYFMFLFFCRNGIRLVFTGYDDGRDGILPSRFHPYCHGAGRGAGAPGHACDTSGVCILKASSFNSNKLWKGFRKFKFTKKRSNKILTTHLKHGM